MEKATLNCIVRDTGIDYERDGRRKYYRSMRIIRG